MAFIHPWSDAEVQSLLCLAADENVRSELDETRNEEAYKTISQKMTAQHGFQRSSRQCRSKLTKLKCDYFKIKNHNAQIGSDQQTSKWFTQLDAMFGQQQTNAFSATPQRVRTDVTNMSPLSVWSNAEVQSLLCFAADQSIRGELEASRNERAYKTLSLKMAQHGFQRSSRQCRMKLKKMKYNYFRIKNHNAHSGSERKTCKWYTQLDAVFGQSPSVAAVSNATPQQVLTDPPNVSHFMWSDAELRFLLCFASDESVRNELLTFRNERAYKIISQKMASHGFERTSQQCRVKLKKMKMNYFRFKNQTAQNGSDQKTCKWYTQLDAIFGRPPTKMSRAKPQRVVPDKPHNVLPLSSLRLLVSPLQLMAAALWGVVQDRAVVHYELLEDFITSVLNIIPELLTHSERVQLVLGLRAKMVLEICRRDDLHNRQNIERHLKRLDNLIKQEDKEAYNSTTKASVDNFSKVVSTLLEDPYERDIFYQKTFPSEFGFNFDSALCTLVKKFLMNLEKLLPVPSLEQTSQWLGLSPPALRECGDILNQPEPLKKLIKHCKHGYRFLPGHVDDYILSILSKESTDKKAIKAAQKCRCSAPEKDVADVIEEVPSVDVTLPLDGSNTDPQDCDTSVGFLYQRQSSSGKTFSCLDCGQGFGSLFEMKRHCISGCPANTVKDNTGVCGGSKEEEHLLKDSEANTKHSLSNNKSREAAASSDFTNHMRGHTEDGSHTSGQCGKEIDDYDNYMSHQENECKSSRKHSMDVDYSQEIHSGQKELKECAVVLERISDNMLSCEVCGQRFLPKDFETHTRHCLQQNQPMKKLVISNDTTLIKACELNSLPSVCKKNVEADSEAPLNQNSKESQNGATNNGMMKCTLCDATFCKLILMTKHYSDSHNIKGPYQCPVCNTTFVRLSDLVKHQRYKRIFQCDTCKRCYTLRSKLKAHKKIFNNTCTTLHTCEICSKTFMSATLLQQHIIVHRSKSEGPVCSRCGKTFCSKETLQVHMDKRRCGFSCSICAKVFHQEIVFRWHVDRHSGQGPYMCEICGEGWPTEKYLRIHMIKHSDERPFTCDQCGMSFKSKSTLHSHFRRKHTNDRPFKCSLCSKAFAFSPGLKKHMMKHTGVRPFVCSRCGKGFRRRDELKTHQKTKCF